MIPLNVPGNFHNCDIFPFSEDQGKPLFSLVKVRFLKAKFFWYRTVVTTVTVSVL